MLRSLVDLARYKVSGTDGDVGDVVEFLIDDERWIVRYLVAATGGYFDERSVLLSPLSFGRADWATHRFHVALTMARIKASPSIDPDKPVSRRHEHDHAGYYGHPYYWGYPARGMGASGLWDTPLPARSSSLDDVHLRSIEELCGYHVEGSDGAIGHVQDFIVDDATWEIRYVVVDTKSWWFGKRVLVAPRWAKRVSWPDRKVHVDLSRAAIKSSPEWIADATINREYEQRLYDYYGWAGGEPWSTGPQGHSDVSRPGLR